VRVVSSFEAFCYVLIYGYAILGFFYVLKQFWDRLRELNEV